MKKLWSIIVALACLLLVAVGLLHVWSERREKANVRNGRELALGFICEGYLRIEMGEGKAWRPTFERLLSERYGLKFPFRPSGGYCGGYISDDSFAVEHAFTKVMHDEVAKRFEPGVLERVAEDAEKLYQAEQAGDKPPL